MPARTPEKGVPAASKGPAPKAGQRLHRTGRTRPEPGCPSRAGRSLGDPSPWTSSHPRRRPSAKAAGQPGTQRLGEPGPHSTSGVGGARPSLTKPRTRVRLSVRPGAPRWAVRRAAGLGARRRRNSGIAGPRRLRVWDRDARSLPSAPRAAAAVPHGSGSSTIVSGRSGGGRSKGGSSAPGPAPSRRCHPAEAGRGTRGGGTRPRAKLRAGQAAAGPAFLRLLRRRVLG